MTIKKLGLLFLYIGIVIGLAVPALQIRPFNFGQYISILVQDYYANISTDFLNIAITLLLVDTIIAKRDLQEKKEQLKRGLRHRDVGRIEFSIDELKTSGWIQDGSLEGIDLIGANLSNQELNKASLARANLLGANLAGAYLFDANLKEAILIKANLQGTRLSGSNMTNAYLEGANLEGARINRTDLSGACFSSTTIIKNASLMKSILLDATGLNEEIFATAHALRGTIMPDGQLYDGRFSLLGDLEFAKIDKIDSENPNAMKEWYLGGSSNES